MMAESVDDGDSTSPSDQTTGSPSSSHQTTDDETEVKYQSLFSRYSAQQKELERLEEQNSEYREKLLKTIRERDLNDDLLKTIRDEQKKEADERKRQIRDLEIQLKAVLDKSSAQEAHYNVTMKDLTVKYNASVGILTKKADQAEREKNEAVIKYATREAEIMRVRAETQKKQQELTEALSAKAQLETCQSQDNIDHLENTVSSLRVELEKVKHERFDLENRLKMSEKRAEAGQTSIAELRQQCEVLRKQLIQTKDEKNALYDENRQLLNKTQQQETRLLQETDSSSKSQTELEERLREASQETARHRQENRELHERMEVVGRENLELLTKLQDLEDKLELEEEAHGSAKKELERLRGIEARVKKSSEEAARARSAQETAEKEREVAERESSECRAQAERMLQITEQLAQRNSQLATEAEQEREKNRSVEQELVEVRGALDRTQSRLAERERDLEDASGCSSSELETLKEDLRKSISRCHELQQSLTETKNDYAAYKKKQTANVKELKHELSSLRRQLDSGQGDQSYLTTPSVDTVASFGSRSRTSSLTSIDRATSGSQEDTASLNKTSDEAGPSMQQVMVDKIVLLQRKLARRTEKIEFLEEHVKQCLEELQKKTKIIQHYALREEASLLLPNDSSFEQVPVLRKGSSYALMGSMFATGEKKALQLTTEINSRLQAVLEDALIKNITLKNSVDSLGNEVSRLSRENRILSLTSQSSANTTSS